MAAIKAEHKRTVMQKVLATSVAALMIATQVLAPAAVHAEHDSSTATPIKHVVVIFGENVSFDHYFGTYPQATNTDGVPFHAARNTAKVNGLTEELLTRNPNRYNPKRLRRSQALTCDQNHDYTAEQQAVHEGRMDRF